MRVTDIYAPAELREMETIFQGQCCDCKINEGNLRVWLCRVEGGVTIEKYDGYRWNTVAGSCTERG